MDRVTIGMPLYNNARTISAALDSLLAQTAGDFQIIISDDGSSDDTPRICAEYARRDSRVTYIRQPKNLNYLNFKFVLDRASTPFFMWAAGDDRWAPTFIEKNLERLQADSHLVASVSKVRFERGDQRLNLSRGTYPLLGTVEDNLVSYFSDPSDNSRMYGVFRTEALRKSFPERGFHAYDWALSAATLRYGSHFEVPEELMFRDWTPPERYAVLVRKDHASPITRLFPALAMTGWLIFSARIPLTWRIVGTLLALNVDKHYEYCGAFHPRYMAYGARVEKWWRRHVRWRLISQR